MPSDEEVQQYSDKFVGKKFVESYTGEEGTFSKNDLPSNTRFHKPGQMLTAEFAPDRLTVTLDEDGKCTSVTAS